jgi:hypothetical protein
MIPYYYHLASSSSRCGTRRFAIVPCSWKARRPNTSLDWCPHPNDRGPYRTGLSTCLGTRWIGIHFSFPRSKDQPMGKVLSFFYLLTYKTIASARPSGIRRKTARFLGNHCHSDNRPCCYSGLHAFSRYWRVSKGSHITNAEK